MTEPQLLLTTEDCETILHNYTKRKDCKVTSYTIEPLSDTREGFIGEHFFVKINYENQTQRFFLKILNGSSKIIFELSMSLNAYEKEEFFYMTLLKEFDRYGIDVSFAPKVYLCKPYLIVLEDLTTSGYKSVPKQNPLNLEHCKASLDVLAKFHTSGIIYEELKSKELGVKYSLLKTYPKHFEEKLFSKEENAASKWLRHTMEGIFELVNLIPENHFTKEEFKNKLEEALGGLLEINNLVEKKGNTMLHGDLWSNNFLYFYKNDIPITSKLIDYQILKFGPPPADVVQFIFTNTRKNFRDKHFNELLEHYYQSFSNCLKEESLNTDEILSKDEFLNLCEDIKFAAKLQTIADRSITFLSDDTYSKAFTSEEALCKFLFEERGKNITQSFHESDKFRELITEDMLELRDMLFQE